MTSIVMLVQNKLDHETGARGHVSQKGISVVCTKPALSIPSVRSEICERSYDDAFYFWF